MSDAKIPILVCPECGATLSDRDQRCWLCDCNFQGEAGRPAAPLESLPRAAAKRIQGRYREGRFQFSLASLMLLITLAAVCLGVFAYWPGVGVSLGLIALPALIRTAILASYRRQEENPLSGQEWVVSYVYSVWIVWLTWAASGFAAMAAIWVALATYCSVLIKLRNPLAETIVGILCVVFVIGTWIWVIVFFVRKYWRFSK